MNGPFGALDGDNVSDCHCDSELAATDSKSQSFGMSLDFSGLEGPDVLDNFDFDSFLNNDAGDASFAFDANMAFGTDGGLEAGGDV